MSGLHDSVSHSIGELRATMATLSSLFERREQAERTDLERRHAADIARVERDQQLLAALSALDRRVDALETTNAEARTAPHAIVPANGPEGRITRMESELAKLRAPTAENAVLEGFEGRHGLSRVVAAIAGGLVAIGAGVTAIIEWLHG